MSRPAPKSERPARRPRAQRPQRKGCPQPVRFAILGTRGIPARYGGFETFAEELSTRLAQRGHRSRSIAASAIPKPSYRGVRLQYLPTIRHKYFDTIAHTCSFDAASCCGSRYDALLYCNAANAVFTWMPRVFGMPVALNVDGLERNRKKVECAGEGLVPLSRNGWRPGCPTPWSPTPRHRQLLSRSVPARFGDDSLRRGTRAGRDHRCARRNWACEAEDYFLYVSRMEPENNALLVREAFERVDTPI